MSNNASFFALLSRMKYIPRWSLMRNASAENLSEHTLETAVLAHCLVMLHNERFAGAAGPLSAERAATLALFHDVPEVLTGDLPTPVKYHSGGVREAYAKVEKSACDTLLSFLPPDLRPHYAVLLRPAEEEQGLWRYVKAADKLSALIKCIEEQKAGSREFLRAEEATLAALRAMRLPEVDCFLTEFLSAYAEPLDGMMERRKDGAAP
ncbi:MAG: 5'-deoxynucleotidase [Oscillospiraceae bacterium]|jgi:5'-deoxynucleotidase|nr:5'-deoxynucleotidase [Oscillospiraceae bacterium]